MTFSQKIYSSLIYQIHPDTQHLDGPFSEFRLDRSESHSFHATALAPICPRGGKDHGNRIGQVLGHVASPLDQRDFHGDFMEKTWEWMGIHRNFMELHRIQWDLMGVHRIFIGFHVITMEIWWVLMEEQHGISWHVLIWIPWNPMRPILIWSA